MLKKAIEKGVLNEDIVAEQVTQLSRLLRDITVEEANFLLRTIGYKTILIDFNAENDKESITIRKQGKEYLVLGGLITLGLVHLSSTRASVDAYHFSNVAYELVEFLR